MSSKLELVFLKPRELLFIAELVSKQSSKKTENEFRERNTKESIKKRPSKPTE